MSANGAFLIGLDQGTTNTKAVVVDASGRIEAQASRPIATRAPRPGWVEQDAEAMVENAIGCVREVLETSGRDARDAVGLGLCNQTETLVVWDSGTGRPVLPAILWQCRRGDDELEPLRSEKNAALVYDKTGLDLDPTFTAVKLKWVFDNHPAIASALADGRCLFGTVDCWLIWKLTGGATYASEPGNASRTMLFDIGSFSWSRELLELFSLCLRRMPRILRSADSFGCAQAELFGSAIPITAALGDQQASLFGHGCFARNEAKVTYGTGAFAWINAGNDGSVDCPRGLVRTVAWQLDERCYAFEGFVMSAGAALEWTGRRLGVEDGGRGVVREAERLATSDAVFLIPAFQGLATPWWRPEVRGALIGLSEATERGHICHAALEAVCYQIRTVLDAAADTTRLGAGGIRVDGGLTRSGYLMQLQADVLQRAVTPSRHDAVSAYGAALMAGVGAGLWSGVEDLRALISHGIEVSPDPVQAARWDAAFERWCEMVNALLKLYDEL